jgi:hypothetical protein
MKKLEACERKEGVRPINRPLRPIRLVDDLQTIHTP